MPTSVTLPPGNAHISSVVENEAGVGGPGTLCALGSLPLKSGQGNKPNYRGSCGSNSEAGGKWSLLKSPRL